MAGKRQSQDPVNAIKVVASTMLNSFLEDLKEKNVLNKQELQTMGQTVNVITKKTENLVGDLTEKTQVVGKIFKDHFLNSGSLLSLKSHAENEDECSESSSAGKRQSQDPVNAIKVVASTMLNSFLEDLKEKNVLNKQELQTMGQTVNVITKKTENLVGDLTEKTQVVGKIFKDHFLNSGSLLSLKSHAENEDECSESSSAVLQEIQASQVKVRKLCPCDHSHEPKITNVHEIYPVMEKEGRTRLALIICNSEFDYLSKRQGSEIDILGMQDLLENLGYSVVVKENLSALEMKTELKNFAARQEHKFSDSTFLVFMSHGTLDGICGTKHRNEEPDILHDDTIFQIFNNRNCRSLKDKPKVIIMQACRGRGDGAVWVTDVGEASAWTCDQPLQCYIFNDAIEKTHVEKDFIAFKSSTPHNVSWRLNTDGSLFISHLIHYFREFSCCHHLEEIFRKVQNSFETPNTMIQMPTIERVSMTRYFYLFPGN
ncbi:caspase-12 [Canis lupus baileyi]|uniref:Isoform 2 of Caspase-12 n=1 Tax=Canis lupus familiaris TaxID=9615 RepID=Q075B4-2|nr:caspase-12 [Canis lupus familiaris]XP_025321482.1 caspase-12 isoform X1 [Canis lupus dingo]ABB58696.1 caspase-12/a [Canis lupus familiaris]|eukprot:NP_001070704.1 caspase-12 [Canis lupus familiaris]